jgi:hypothetical protein
VLGISVAASVFDICGIIKKASATSMNGLPCPTTHCASNDLVESAEEKHTLKEKVAMALFMVKDGIAGSANNT